MSKNWAIVVGINQYNPNNFSPLKYAKHDAELIRSFFIDAKFDEICFFTDDSPDLKLSSGSVIHTRPTLGNLRSFLHDRFATKPFLSPGDNCWFFFAGHGEQYANRDYLMPQDANPRDIEYTAIPVSYVRERLCRSGADNVILILDACRSEGSRSSTGVGNEWHQGVITVSSCSPTQRSWEIDELQHGAFTYALHEAFQIPGERNCATVKRLDQYLRCRVPELCRLHRKFPEQIPCVVPDPLEKEHFVLLPQYATPTDIAVLKSEIYRLAFINQNLDLAEQLCVRANATAKGQDLEILNLYVQVKQLSQNRQEPSTYQGSESRQNINSSVSSNTSRNIETDQSSIIPKTYSRLNDLLKAELWLEADEETQLLILRSAKRIKQGWLEPSNIDKLSCTVLRAIDQLWIQYSDGLFGFSIQKKIYTKNGGIPDGAYDKNSWNSFCECVGWRRDEKWVAFSDFRFDLSAPPGHLPSGVRINDSFLRRQAAAYWNGITSLSGYKYLEETNLIGWYYFFARLESCRL